MTLKGEIYLGIIVMLIYPMRIAIGGSNGDVIVTRRGKFRGGRQKFKANSTQTPYGNKTPVSVDKETQMTPQTLCLKK